MKLQHIAVQLLAIAVLSMSSYAGEDDYEYNTWTIGAADDWTSTNWVGTNNLALPAPGYPGTNAIVEIPCGTVSVTTQDVATVAVNISDNATLIVTNSRTMQLRAMNFRGNRYSPGRLIIADGTVNNLNVSTGDLRDLVVDLGVSGNGYLDLGSTWGSTNGFPSNFGDLGNVVINVNHGGLRVDAYSIRMALGCELATYNGQEVSFRGDWLNADTTTVFTIVGNGANLISISNDFSFGGCTLAPTLDTNGISLIRVGGNAYLTNATIKVDASSALTNTATAYDIVRVPAVNDILTNGMSIVPGTFAGVKCAASLDLDRSGYDYLVLTVQQYLPQVAITNPASDTIVQSGTNIVIAAMANDKDGSITKVEFYSDATNKIGEATGAPYEITWTNVLAGSYDITAIASDSDGNQGKSESISLGVTGLAADGRQVFITGGAIITHDPGCAQ